MYCILEISVQGKVIFRKCYFAVITAELPGLGKQKVCCTLVWPASRGRIESARKVLMTMVAGITYLIFLFDADDLARAIV